MSELIDYLEERRDLEWVPDLPSGPADPADRARVGGEPGRAPDGGRSPGEWARKLGMEDFVPGQVSPSRGVMEPQASPLPFASQGSRWTVTVTVNRMSVSSVDARADVDVYFTAVAREESAEARRREAELSVSTFSSSASFWMSVESRRSVIQAQLAIMGACLM